jgi:hypothetical protein
MTSKTSSMVTRKLTSNRVRNLLYVCGLAMMLAPLSANAQSAVPSTLLSSPVYDLNKEIKIQGTIEKIETVTQTGPLGTHLLVLTAEGVVDVHLGASMAVSAKNLGLSTGESIDVTGMMTAIGGNSVLLARLLTTPDHVYVLRNERGAPVRSLMPRGSSSPASTQKGGL